MSKPVRITPEAAEDIRQARAYLDGRRSGLGDDFADELLHVLDFIRDFPEMHGEVEPGLRAASLKRFGYVVYYRVHGTESEVLAVLHGSRSADARRGRG